MFKKYFTHEFKNTCQMPLTVCGLILGISLLVCLGALLKLESLLTLGIIALVVSVYACVIMSYISIHKTMTGRLFSKGGYLTLTLPVGTHTILISKILVNLIYAACYMVSLFAGIIIVMAGFGVFENINVTMQELMEVFSDLVSRLDLLAIEGFVFLISFVFLLCFILFCNAFSSSGYIKKQNKMVKFLVLVAFIIVLSYIMTIDIIPYSLIYSDESGYRIISTTDLDYQFIFSSVVDFSSLFWMLLGTVGLYFGSYYLIKNKIDVL